jgi:hypothetical protein
MEKHDCTITGSSVLSRQAPRWVRIFIFGICVIIILLVLKGLYSTEYGFTEMLRYGEKFETSAFNEVKQVHRKIFPGYGFDGQFYANLAIDPTLTHKNLTAVMDLPQYRSRRIFMPLCAFLLGRGNPALTINAYALGNFIFWIGLCILVFYKIRPSNLQDYACTLMIIFSSGVVGSALLALTDMPSTVFLFAALIFPTFWPLLFCCGILTRETTILFTPVFLVIESLQKKRPLSIVLKSVISITPAFLWYGYSMWRIPEPIFIEKVYGLPFLAMFHRLGSIAYHWPGTFYPHQLLYFLTAISLTAQCAYFALRRRLMDPIWLTGATSAFFFTVMGYASWMEYSWMLRYSLPMTFAFNLLLAKEDPRTFATWFPLGNIGCMYL